MKRDLRSVKKTYYSSTISIAEYNVNVSDILNASSVYGMKIEYILIINDEYLQIAYSNDNILITEAVRTVFIQMVLGMESLTNGLKYIEKDKKWGGAKIYDPTKGMRVNVSAEFVEPGKLKLRATILGMGVTIYWQKLN